MRKAKNIILLIGIIFNFLYIFWQLANFVYQCIESLLHTGSDILQYYIYFCFYPSLITIALMLLPVLLLILNLKNKVGKVLPVISAVMCGASALLMVFYFITPSIMQYLVYCKLEIIDSYLMCLIYYIKDGGILLFTGFLLLTVGSIMSRIKSKE